MEFWQEGLCFIKLGSVYCIFWKIVATTTAWIKREDELLSRIPKIF